MIPLISSPVMVPLSSVLEVVVLFMCPTSDNLIVTVFEGSISGSKCPNEDIQDEASAVSGMYALGVLFVDEFLFNEFRWSGMKSGFGYLGTSRKILLLVPYSAKTTVFYISILSTLAIPKRSQQFPFANFSLQIFFIAKPYTTLIFPISF